MSFFENTAQMLMAAGVLLAVIDIVFLGFATFFLTLIGLATLTTGVLLQFGIISDTWTVISLCIAVLSGVYSAILWKPLSNLQKTEPAHNVHSDLFGHQFRLETAVSPTQPGSYQYSGITWKIESDEPLLAGDKVEVTDIQVGLMTVKSVSNK
ncbi:NfeD family protein [Psychrosphaera aestuarii]|uniref:NfeD family protein n=1 Tax=Psychrosphaera aestuarii TaxID=1266052 RepID=UPI001B31CF16|nr:NfeD family protein [Psychrosphaera aestuarii]